jgi:peptidyl-prolyl isomerase G (cyclophilin G)
MANRGPNTNGSQFFITLRDCPHLNGMCYAFSTVSYHNYSGLTRARITPGKHVVFGKVIRGFDDVVRKIAQVSTDEKDRPAVPVIIFNCGELELRKKTAPPCSCISLSPLFWKVMAASYSSSCALLPAKEPSVSASESGDETEKAHKHHKRRQRSRSPGNAAERDSKRHKRKRKHKQRKDEGHSPSRSEKGEPVGERKETEEEYDARLEREENERLAAARKRELERLSQQREQEAQSTNGVRFKGTFCPRFL